MRDTASPTLAAKTDREGRFTISLESGEPRLRATLIGYRPLTLTARAGVELEMALQPDTLRQSDSIEVTAGPFAADRDLAAGLAGSELRNLAGVLADDPLRAVQSMPGVASSDDFRAQFSIRGAGFNRIGVYLDGILIHTPFHTVQGEPTSASLSVIQGELLESANIYTGPLPPAYGDRTAGALDFRTREGDAHRRSVRLTAGASNAGVSAEGPLGKRATWLVAARKSYLQYIINRTADEPSLGFAFWDVQGKLAYTLTPRHQLSLTAIDGHSGLERDPNLVRLGLNAISQSVYHYTLTYLGWRYTAGSLLLTQRAAWLNERYDNDNLNRTRLQQGRYGEAIWNGDAAKSWSPRLVTEGGWTVRRLRDRAFADLIGAAASRRIDEYSGAGTRSGAYLQQAWSLTPRVQLRFGGRHDRHTVNSRGIWLGHAGLTVPAWRGARWQLTWSQTAQYPELQQFQSRGGSRQLDPERSTQAQLGLDQSLGERSRIRVELYDRQDRRLLFLPFAEPRLLSGNRVYSPPLVTPWENSVRGYARGGQVFFQRRSANGFTGWLSYGYNRSRLRDARTGLAFDADFETRHLVQLFGSQRLRPTVNLSAKLVYGSGTPIRGFYEQRGSPSLTDVFLSQSRNLLRLPDYQRTDVRVNKLFVRKRYQLTLFAEVINLTNRRNLRLDDFGGFDFRTGRARIQLERSFPILPSAGIVVDF